jgi:cholesterol oxidase
LRDLQERSLPSTLIMAGDQIYADATAGLFDPAKLDQPWDRAWDARNDNPWLKMATGAGAQIALLDDHEIADNWEPSKNKARNAALNEEMYRGRSRFIQRIRAGQSIPGASSDERKLWYPTDINGHLLFVGNTRSEREARDPAKLDDALIMVREQMDALRQQLLDAHQKCAHTHKLVVTPSMLLPRPLGLAGDAPPAAALRCDSWCGYPASLHQLLAHIADRNIQHCVFLSGDEHLPCLAEIKVQRIDEPNNPVVTLHSIHAGALYAPYPFANARPASFIQDDHFDFFATFISDDVMEERHYACSVQATFPPVRHEGYVKIQLQNDASQPSALSVTFRDALDPNKDITYCP